MNPLIAGIAVIARERRNLDSRLQIELVRDFGENGVYSRNATDCTPETSKRLRQRMFLHITRSSRRTM